jgi:hypothetical protein
LKDLFNFYNILCQKKNSYNETKIMKKNCFYFLRYSIIKDYVINVFVQYNSQIILTDWVVKLFISLSRNSERLQ